MKILANNSAHDDVQTFNFNGLPLRALLIDGEPWFVALDLANILEYRMASDMLRVVDEEDKGTRPMRTPGGTQNLAVISEPAFYKIVVQRQSGRLQKKSSREMVTNFQRWVTHEVLPTIRKTGSYAVTPARELTGAELMAKALVEAQKVLEAKDAQIAQLAPKADVYDIVVKDQAYDFRQVVQTLRSQLPVNERQVREKIVELGWRKYHQREEIDRRTGEPKTKYWSTTPTPAIDAGYIVMGFAGEHNGKARTTPKFTEKAVNLLIDIFSPSTGVQEILEVA